MIWPCTLESWMDGNKLRNFVHNCMDMWIDTFDHAPVYGAGGCEKIFGDEVLRKEPELRSKIKIVTKAGIILPGQKGNKHIFYDSTKSNLLAEMDASLNRLGTDHVDLLLIHRPEDVYKRQLCSSGDEGHCILGAGWKTGTSGKGLWDSHSWGWK